MKIITGGGAIDADGDLHKWREEVELPMTEDEWKQKLNELLVALFRAEPPIK